MGPELQRLVEDFALTLHEGRIIEEPLEELPRGFKFKGEIGLSKYQYAGGREVEDEEAYGGMGGGLSRGERREWRERGGWGIEEVRLLDVQCCSI